MNPVLIRPICLGVALDLPPESEEVAGFYGAMLETDHAQDAVFNKNFFTDFLKLLKKFPPVSDTPSPFTSHWLIDLHISVIMSTLRNLSFVISDPCSNSLRQRRRRRSR